jgi:hypothetical protein
MTLKFAMLHSKKYIVNFGYAYVYGSCYFDKLYGSTPGEKIVETFIFFIYPFQKTKKLSLLRRPPGFTMSYCLIYAPQGGRGYFRVLKSPYLRI